MSDIFMKLTIEAFHGLQKRLNEIEARLTMLEEKMKPRVSKEKEEELHESYYNL